MGPRIGRSRCGVISIQDARRLAALDVVVREQAGDAHCGAAVDAPWEVVHGGWSSGYPVAVVADSFHAGRQSVVCAIRTTWHQSRPVAPMRPPRRPGPQRRTGTSLTNSTSEHGDQRRRLTRASTSATATARAGPAPEQDRWTSRTEPPAPGPAGPGQSRTVGTSTKARAGPTDPAARAEQDRRHQSQNDQSSETVVRDGTMTAKP